MLSFFFFFNDTATTEIYTLSLHDALPICSAPIWARARRSRCSCCRFSSWSRSRCCASPAGPKWGLGEARGALCRGGGLHGLRRLPVLLDAAHGVQTEPRPLRRCVRHAARAVDLQRPAHPRARAAVVRADGVPPLGVEIGRASCREKSVDLG